MMVVGSDGAAVPFSHAQMSGESAPPHIQGNTCATTTESPSKAARKLSDNVAIDLSDFRIMVPA